MTDPIRNSEPAFPVDTSRQEDGTYGHQTGNHTWQHSGMTLRDYFAGKALQAMNPAAFDARRGWSGIQGRFNNDARAEASAIADTAYLIADAMLKRRGE